MIAGHIKKDNDGKTYLKVDGENCLYNAYTDCEIIKIQRVADTWEVRVRYKTPEGDSIIYSCFCDSIEMDEELWNKWVYN